MKITIGVLILLIYTSVCAQKSDELYIVYYNYANEAEYYFHENEFDSAKIYFERAFKFVNEPSPYHLEKYTRSLWKLDFRKKALRYLSENLHLRSLDTNWYIGINEKQIQKITEQRIKKWNLYQKQRSYFQQFADSLSQIDQHYRKNYYSDSTKRHLIWQQDELNGIALIKFTRQYGFPGGKNNWGHDLSALILHMSPDWFIENYSLLFSEVQCGNLEPWMLAQGIDRMFTIETEGKKLTPYNRYWKENSINPFLMFQNCVSLGVSPYYHFNWRITQAQKTVHFEYYKANKKYYNTSLKYTSTHN